MLYDLPCSEIESFARSVCNATSIGTGLVFSDYSYCFKVLKNSIIGSNLSDYDGKFPFLIEGFSFSFQ